MLVVRRKHQWSPREGVGDQRSPIPWARELPWNGGGACGVVFLISRKDGVVRSFHYIYKILSIVRNAEFGNCSYQ